MFRVLLRPFCSHFFTKSIRAESIKRGDDNFIYHHDDLICSKCNAYYVVTYVHDIERDFYKKWREEE
ncbi:MAG: hypothetical protein ACLTC1_07510 [Turicibacter sp.]